MAEASKPDSQLTSLIIDRMSNPLSQACGEPPGCAQLLQVWGPFMAGLALADILALNNKTRSPRPI
jgi:hypothetical protein